MLNEKESYALVKSKNKTQNNGWISMLLTIAFSSNEEGFENFFQKVIQMREYVNNALFDVVKKHSKVAQLSRYGKRRVKKKNQKRLIKLVCKEVRFGKETIKTLQERIVKND